MSYTAEEIRSFLLGIRLSLVPQNRTTQHVRAEPSSFGSRTAITIGSSSFQDVTAEGNLTLKSFKGKPVTVTVKKTLIGEVISAGQDGKSTKTMEALPAVNPTSIITWQVPLQPGEEKTLDYTYHTYIRP